MSVRAMASNSKVNRRTVRAALQSAWPQPRKSMPPRASKLDELDALLRTKNITGGPGWLIDMLALTRQRLRGGTETQTHWSSQDCRTGRRRAAHPAPFSRPKPVDGTVRLWDAATGSAREG